MIRPGNELLTDRHRSAARWLPTTALNHFDEGNQMQTYDLVREPHKKFYHVHKSNGMFCFIALAKSVTQNIRGVDERHCLSKGMLF